MSEAGTFAPWISDTGLRVFIVLTLMIGGAAAYLAGRGLARAWRPLERLFFYIALLAGAVRFLNYALFDGALLSPYYFAIAYAVLLGLALLGYRQMRTTQMVTQYYWLYERTSPLTWKAR